MSLGYSVGDFIAGANLTYQLIRVLRGSRGASDEYQEAMLELDSMQKAFLQVSQMKCSQVIPLATINSASFIVMSSMDVIADFLERTKKYQKRLGGGQAYITTPVTPGELADTSWCKIGWALYKKEELRQLCDTLRSRLGSVQLLLSSAAW